MEARRPWSGQFRPGHGRPARYGLVITDYQLNWHGLAASAHLKSRLPGCPIIMFTATGNEGDRRKAMKAGLDDLSSSPRAILGNWPPPPKRFWNGSAYGKRAEFSEKRLQDLLST